jgi:prolyl oligopeptidase PreP (S9A serine peptidase family)
LVLEKIENPQLIPDIWIKYDTFSVDSGTRKSAVKDFMTKWVKWERETKQFYTSMRQELVNIGELAAADQLEKYLKDVSDELEQAEKYLIELEAIGYDMVTIIDHQFSLHKKYKKKLGW